MQCQTTSHNATFPFRHIRSHPRDEHSVDQEMERRTKRSRLDDATDSEGPIERHAKIQRLQRVGYSIVRHMESLKLYNFEDDTPRKASHSGSLFTALNRPTFVPLLRLPPELRNHIWQYALRMDGGTFTVREEEDFPSRLYCRPVRRSATKR